MEPAILARIARDVGAPEEAVAAAAALLEAGHAISFIARYRKDLTSGMDEASLRDLQEVLRDARELEARRTAMLRTLEAQGKLTPELRDRIASCRVQVELEDIYLPFRPKRRTRAGAARERGLEPLAEYLWHQEPDAWTLEERADAYIDAEKKVPTREAALEGACQIVAEWISELPELRKTIRDLIWREGSLVSKVVPARAQDKTKYAMYYDRREPLAKVPSHRVLAIRRGTKEGILASHIECDDARALEAVLAAAIRDRQSPFTPALEMAAREGYFRLLRPGIEAELRARLKERADHEAIRVFQVNLANLLLSPPAGAIPVLGINSAKGDECRLVVVDATGAFVPGTVATLTPVDAEAARAVLKGILEANPVKAVAVAAGSGTRAVELLVRQLLADEKLEGVFVAGVNDAGLAAYAGSRQSREEFPELEPAARGAISLARRLQDPLAELVKLEPRAIGVGQYQHDVSQRELSRRLLDTVRSCVNQVGIELNGTPFALLRHAAGLDEALARALIHHRDVNGPFPSRGAVMTLPEMTEWAFLQSAGFLRIRESENPLDRTGIHPEQYPTVERIAVGLGAAVADLMENRELLGTLKLEELVSDGVGIRTLRSIREELLRNGRDPRRPFTLPKVRPDVREIGDLKEGMTLEGTVTNVTNFGAFVDVGVGQDGLVHLSQMSNRFIRDPREAVKVGDVLAVKVISVEAETKRIGLSIKALLPPAPRRRPKPSAKPARGEVRPGPRAVPRPEGAEGEVREGSEPSRREGPRGERSDRDDRGDRSRHLRRRHPDARREHGPRPAGAAEAASAPGPPAPEPEPVPAEPERTLHEKIAILNSKFRGIK